MREHNYPTHPTDYNAREPQLVYPYQQTYHKEFTHPHGHPRTQFQNEMMRSHEHRDSNKYPLYLNKHSSMDDPQIVRNTNPPFGPRSGNTRKSSHDIRGRFD